MAEEEIRYAMPLEKYEALKEFVKKKLKEDKEIYIEDLKEIVPDAPEDIRMLMLVDMVAEVGKDAGALFLELDDEKLGFRVITREEFDLNNENHYLIDMVKMIAEEFIEEVDEGEEDLEGESWN